MCQNSYKKYLKTQLFRSALYVKNARILTNKRGERKGNSPPASPPTVVEDGEMREGEIRVRESVERERNVEKKKKNEEEEHGLLLSF